MRRPCAGVLLLSLVALAGCQEAPVAPEGVLEGPAFAISDGAHGGGNGHFYWLPPMVPAPISSGVFDPGVSPTVEICELAGGSCTAVVATFSGPDVTVDPVAEAYEATWHTKDSGLDPSKTYRIRVLVGVDELGFADVDVVSNGNEKKSVDTANFVAVINGTTLPIHFRIEEGAVPFVAISAAGAHTCALTTGGAVYCWGWNMEGQLGDGTNTDSPVPVPVASAALLFDELGTARGRHTCGITTDGAAYCWGANGFGQLGNGTKTGSNAPVAVSGPLIFSDVTAGANHTCGLTTAGAAHCWGKNGFGELGDGTNTDSEVPVPVFGGITFNEISAGGVSTESFIGEGFTCGREGFSAHCWGLNQFGQLGNGTNTSSNVPVPVGQFTFLGITAGAFHGCQHTPAVVHCWGANGAGQLGDASNTDSNVLVEVVDEFGLLPEISAGGHHTCALDSGGAAYCWGDNPFGELGNGANADSNVPVAVLGGLAFARISTGGDHTCGLTTDGIAYCWGHNSKGQLGNGTQSDSNVPVPVDFP